MSEIKEYKILETDNMTALLTDMERYLSPRMYEYADIENPALHRYGCMFTEGSDEDADAYFQDVTQKILAKEFFTSDGYCFSENDDLYKALQAIGADFFRQEDCYRSMTDEERDKRYAEQGVRRIDTPFGYSLIPADMTDKEFYESQRRIYEDLPYRGICTGNGPLRRDSDLYKRLMEERDYYMRMKL